MHQPSRYSIRFLFRCFLLPSYFLLVYVFLRFKPPKATTVHSDSSIAPFSFTAYIPLSSRSLRSLNILLEPFTSVPSPHLKELVLLCPEDLISRSHYHLAQVIKQEARYHPNTNLNFSLRSTSADDFQAEIFRLASEATTDWVLILDENGIDDISESTLQSLQEGVFFDSTSPGPYDLVSPPPLNQTSPRASIRYWQDPFALTTPLLVPTSSLSAFIPPRDAIVFLFPNIKLIHSASKMICSFLSQRYTLRILLYDQQHILSTDSWKEHRISLPSCSASLTVHQTIPKVSREHNETLLAVPSWLSQPYFIPKVLFSVQEDRPLLEGLLSTHKLTNVNITRIYLPSNQYIYTDWIGSLSLPELQNWHTPQITFSIITHTRPHSLNRLLHSLSSALYFGDNTDSNVFHIQINIDSSGDPETKRLAQTFQLHNSQVHINQRIVHGGLLPAIVESWYPHGNDSYGLLLEDDVELSPLFYAWVKMTIVKYRYGDKPNTSPNLFGISLYQQKHLELPLEGRRPFNARSLFSDISTHIPTNTPYLSSIPCSWGAIYFPEHWREFHEYLSLRLTSISTNLDNVDGEPIVPDVRSSRWSHSWKKFFIELVYLRGYVMLYPNYADFASLSTNHLEAGSHVRGKISPEKRGLFVLPLIQPPFASSDDDSVSTGLLDLPEERLPEFQDLPVLNLTGSITTLDSLIQVGQERAKNFNAL